MENNDDSNSDIMSIRKLVIRSIEKCDDIELLDLIYRILNAEGRAN